MQRSPAACLALTPLLFASLAVATPAIRPVEGQVIEVRANASETLYLWDATAYVIHLRHDRVVGLAGLHALEESALRALRERAQSAGTKNVVLRVLYQKTGAVDPEYGNPTFAGVEKVFTMRASRLGTLKRASEWERALAQGIAPPGLQITMTGKLPR